MKIQIYCQRAVILLCALLLSMEMSMETAVYAAKGGSESLLSVVEESQIRPLTDGSGKYLLKSDGFYCLDADGTRESTAAVHYFDHMEIDGTVLNGYYYHDADGRFSAGNDHMVHLEAVACTDLVFDGFYMAGNLGKLTAAPRVRYFENFTMDGLTLDGYYYFDENGRLSTENEIHTLLMSCNGRMFDGSYYFGGTNGALVQEAGTTPEGFFIDDTGKVTESAAYELDELELELESMISGFTGTWSILVKNLGTGEELVINDQPMYSASLIKVFTLAASYENMENLRINKGNIIQSAPDSDMTKVELYDLLWNMIAVSDNESYNEAVRLQTASHEFLDGAVSINEYLQKEGYTETTVQSILQPSDSPSQSLGGRNTTSVKDCALLLERIFKGSCVSREASEEMLGILLEQECTWKIPEGLPKGTKAANKTGETDSNQHDIAIVYGPKATYILCVMSQDCPEDDGINCIQEISRLVYNYLNL